MKVRLEISEAYEETELVIYTKQVDEDLKRLIKKLEHSNKAIVAEVESGQILIDKEDVYLVRSEGGSCMIYTYDKSYASKLRLYQLEERLGSGFMRISKQAIINLGKLRRIEAGFSGNLIIKLENKLIETVSRTYIRNLKDYLGL